MKSIYELLDELRASSLSKVEQGTKFERLMKAFLTTDPVYAEQFKEVWLWAEWPGNGGKHDTGVDLVALDRLTGLYVAVQCKFYDPDHTISKDVDTFLSASGKVGFVERIFVSTTDRWNRNAEDAIKAQQIPVRRIGVSDLEASPIDWSQFDFATPEVLVTVGKKVAEVLDEHSLGAENETQRFYESVRMRVDGINTADDGGINSEEAATDLAARLPGLRNLPGCPLGTDDAIIAMSDPPGRTACPNPYITDWLPPLHDDERPDPGPFAADTTAGKTSLVFKAHSYPTKVPHEAIMRLLLHYTQPGDIVLDGFCGTGMTGVAAQMCGSPSDKLRREIETEMGPVSWGVRKAVLQDLSPSATFIAAGVNLPVDAKAFDKASAALLDRFDASWSWMYETIVTEAKNKPFKARIDYTVWSEVFTCPQCASEVVFYDCAFDSSDGTVSACFNCPDCHAHVAKDEASKTCPDTISYRVTHKGGDGHTKLIRRMTKVRVLDGTVIDRVEYRPVAIHWRTGRAKGVKTPDEQDLDVLRRVAAAAHIPTFPTEALPISEMGHGSRLAPKGFTHIHHLWPDRSLASIAVLWHWALEEPNPTLRRALLFWIEQSLWGLSWMNRYQPIQQGKLGGSQVNRQMTGVYYVSSLVSECSARYNLEGSSPARGKRSGLVKLWNELQSSSDNVRISTGSSTSVLVPDNSIDYVFVDPPFGANIPYADLALVVEEWQQVMTAVTEEAVQDVKRHKGLPEYANLMEACFREFNRVLKPGRWMTVEFSNSSNDVWLAIQHSLARAGFVVADTRVFDKQQHSYRQVTAANAVKQDLIISVYKPAVAAAERIELAKGSGEGVRAFLAEHLAHLPVKNGKRGDPQPVRERQADRLYDRTVAYHVAREIGVPMTTAEFNTALDRWFLLRDGMYFLPHQAEEWERFRITFKELDQTTLFITGEGSAVQWLRQLLKPKPRPYSDIMPAFFAETQKGVIGWDELPDLKILLEQNFVQDGQSRWMVPDPKKVERSLLAVDVDQVVGNVGGTVPESETYGFGGGVHPGTHRSPTGLTSRGP
jgi:hypothetical protein